MRLAIVVLLTASLLLVEIRTAAFSLPGPIIGGAQNTENRHSTRLGSSHQDGEDSNLEEDAFILEEKVRNLLAGQPGDKSAASAADIRAVLQRPLSTNSGDDTDNNDLTELINQNENDDATEGVFLDPDVYAKSRDLLGPDGSLDLSSSSSSTTPTTDNNKQARSVQGADPRRAMASDLVESFAQRRPPSRPATEGASMADLMDAMREQQQKLRVNATESEGLHQQVLASEEGFREQSKVFRDSLVNASKAVEAAELRNGGALRRKHTQAMESLAQQLEEFETSWNHVKVEHPCFKCGCELTQEEIAHAEKQQVEAICQVCFSEEIYRTHKLNERRSDRSSPSSNRYTSFANSFPSPYAANGASRGANQRPRPKLSPRAASQRPRSITTAKPQESTSKEISSPVPQKAEQSQTQQRPAASVDSPGSRDTGLGREDKFRDKNWVKVEDPDSGEMFYWNTQTDEMEWDIE